MARPSGFDKDAAIQTAMQEIWRNGYEQSSVKALSEKLGITRSSYYNAFGSREELFKAVLQLYFAQSPDRVLHGDLPPVPIRTLITDTFRAVCASRACDPQGRGCLAINSLAELAGKHPELGPLLMGAVLRSAERFEYLLTIATNNGELPLEANTHGMALALQNLLIGINAFSKVLHSEDELWLTAKTTLMALGLYQEEIDA